MHRYILLGKDTFRRLTVVLKLGGCKLEKSKIKIHFISNLKQDQTLFLFSPIITKNQNCLKFMQALKI